MLIEIPAQCRRGTEHFVTECRSLVHHLIFVVLFVLAFMIFIMITLMLLVMITFVLFTMLIIVVHLGNETIAVYLIKSHTQIQRGKSQIVRAEEAQRGLCGVHRGHESLLTNDGDFLLGVVQHDPADTLACAQIKGDRDFRGLITEYCRALLVVMTLVAFFLFTFGVLLHELVVRVLHGKVDGIQEGNGCFE